MCSHSNSMLPRRVGVMHAYAISCVIRIIGRLQIIDVVVMGPICEEFWFIHFCCSMFKKSEIWWCICIRHLLFCSCSWKDHGSCSQNWFYHHKIYNIFLYFIIRLISNIVYLRVDCDQIKQENFTIIAIFIFTHYPLKIETKNKDLWIIDKLN